MAGEELGSFHCGFARHEVENWEEAAEVRDGGGVRSEGGRETPVFVFGSLKSGGLTPAVLDHQRGPSRAKIIQTLVMSVKWYYTGDCRGRN
jgi:hypothetical protein